MPYGAFQDQSQHRRRNALAAEPRSGRANGHRAARSRIGFRPGEADRALLGPARRYNFATADMGQLVELSTWTASLISSVTYQWRCAPTSPTSVRQRDASGRRAPLSPGSDSADARRYVRPRRPVYRLSRQTPQSVAVRWSAGKKGGIFGIGRGRLRPARRLEESPKSILALDKVCY